MKLTRFRSLRWRLLGSYLFLTLLAVILAGVLALTLVRQQAQRQEQEYLTAHARTAAAEALPLLRPSPQTEALSELAQATALLNDVTVRFFDAAGNLLAQAEAPGPLQRSSVVVSEAPEGEAGTGSEYLFRVFPATPSTVTGTSPISGALPFPDTLSVIEPPRSESVVRLPIGAPSLPVGFVEVTGAEDLVGPAVARTREAFVWAGLIATAVALIVGVLVSFQLTAPLQALTASAGQIRDGDLTVRAPTYGDDEVGELAVAFNEMASQLETNSAELALERDTLRRFMSNASHELRTPITALRAFNELLREGASDYPEVRAEFLAESAEQIERMVCITEHLLDLTRLDAGVAALDVEQCVVAELLDEAVNPFTLRAEEQRVKLAVEQPPPDLEVRCDRARLVLALNRLLDNALKFTGEGGQIRVGASRHNGELRLWVRDTGEGIRPEALPHVFERFYRGDRRRPGSGLGLALVKSVVEAHGGRVAVKSTPGRGSQFVIVLPS
jgi:signal transduction histidine kinase